MAFTNNNYKFAKGLNKEIVASLSEQKNEPEWMTDFRLAALAIFERLPLPGMGGRFERVGSSGYSLLCQTT